MPIGFAPTDVATISLPCFASKPEAERPRFKFRFLSAGQIKKVERLRDEAARAKGEQEADALVNAAILEGLLGWENLRDHDGGDVPFSPEALDEFTLRLKFQMAIEYPRELLYTEAAGE
jgi:hypothetical protein